MRRSPATPSSPGSRARWKKVFLSLLVLGIWSIGVRQTLSRSVSVEVNRAFLDDLTSYESLRQELEGVAEVWLLVERPTQRRLRNLPRGQIQKAQYTLAPTVVRNMRSLREAEKQVRSAEDSLMILHFFVTDAHQNAVEERLSAAASDSNLEMKLRPAGKNLLLYQFEKRGGTTP